MSTGRSCAEVALALFDRLLGLGDLFVARRPQAESHCRTWRSALRLGAGAPAYRSCARLSRSKRPARFIQEVSALKALTDHLVRPTSHHPTDNRERISGSRSVVVTSEGPAPFASLLGGRAAGAPLTASRRWSPTHAPHMPTRAVAELWHPTPYPANYTDATSKCVNFVTGTG